MHRLEILTLIVLATNRKSCSTYDPKLIELLDFDEKTKATLIDNDDKNNWHDTSHDNDSTKVIEVERRTPLDDIMAANADFGMPADIFHDTDKLMKNLKIEAMMLARDTKDNHVEAKYVFSLMKYFHLKFAKIYNSEDPLLVPQLYEKAFDEAINFTMTTRRYSNALQLAAPVRKVTFILGSVIDTLVEIIQTTCDQGSQDWHCAAKYYIILAKEASLCPDIWIHHHKVFVETLKLIQKNQTTLLDITKNVMDSVNYMTSYYPRDNPSNRRYFDYDQYVGDVNGELENSNSKYIDALAKSNATETLDSTSIHQAFEKPPIASSESMTKSNSKMAEIENHDFRNGADAETRNDESINHKKIINENLGDAKLRRPVRRVDEKNKSLITDSEITHIFTHSNDNNHISTRASNIHANQEKTNKDNYRRFFIDTVHSSENFSNIKNILTNYLLSATDDFYDDFDRKDVLFDSSLKLLRLFRPVLKEYMLTMAGVYKLIGTYQEDNKLPCILLNWKPLS